jgi:electron transport complex protein RnfC
VQPLVKRGEVVKAGQIIGRDDDVVSSPLHAPVNGTVNAVKSFAYFGKKVQAVFITSDGSTDWQPLEGCSEQWPELPPDKLEELAYLSGVTALGSSGIPTRYKSSVVGPLAIKHVIIHHAEAEVFNPSLALLLKGDRFLHFVEGLKIVQVLMRDAKCHLALNFTQAEQLFNISDALDDGGKLSYYTLKPKYPQQQDEVLISTIVKSKIPPGAVPAESGVVILTVQDVLHVYDAIVTGKPLIEKMLLLAGPGFERPSHAMVRIGTPLQEVISSNLRQNTDVRLVLNSPVTGREIPDSAMPVTKDWNQVVAVLDKQEGDIFAFAQPGFIKDTFSNTAASRASLVIPFFKKRLITNINGEHRACISCGFCSSVCPVRLYPNLLHHYVERQRLNEDTVKYGIFKCIECNLCTYVCTSKIPVAQLLKQGKQQLLEEGFHPEGL